MVLLILALAAGLRFYKLGDYPAGFFCDEASIGYNAFTILHTGRDEHGVKFPLYFAAFGEYKNPVYIYCTVPFVALFGLDEFSTRFPAALFGLLTVLFAFLLFREMFSTREGVLAALMLAICNWHIHFSRIAFELISLPCLFTAGLYLLYRGTVRKTVCLFPAAFVLGLSLYTYGTGKIFIPLFLVGYLILFARYFWRKKLATLLAVCVFAGTVCPLVWYSIKYPQRARARFDQISVFSLHKSRQDTMHMIVENYKRHFSYKFLFGNGDPIQRHAVPGFGELYRADIPLYILGILVLVFTRRREGFMLLWWLALFPVAAAITQEIPSATRSIIALPAITGVAAVGLAWVFRNMLGSRRVILVIAGIAAVTVYVYEMAREFADYHNSYFFRYPAYSAEGIYGFQYGYRDMIGYMYSQRDNYDRLIVTSENANRPDIFVNFYTAGFSARRPGKNAINKFEIFRAEEYSRYNMRQKILYGLNPKEFAYFTDYDVKREIAAPGGKETFIIAHVKGRKQYIIDWLVLGLFDNRDGAGERREFINLDNGALTGLHDGKYGKVSWRRSPRSFVNINLNGFFGGEDREHRGNPEDVCAYALTYIHAPTEREGLIEVATSNEIGELWVNRASITGGPILFCDKPTTPKQFKVVLRKGENELLLKLCERTGEWRFSVTITDLNRNVFDDLTTHAEMGRDATRMSRGSEVPHAQTIKRRPATTSEVSPVTAPGPPGRSQVMSGHGGVLKGRIVIEQEGRYFFATESDDDSRLFIDGKLVVDNPREDKKRYRSGSIPLKPGEHYIRVERSGAKGDISPRILWTVPGREETEISAGIFEH